MAAIDSRFMRHIARCEVEKLFPGISPAALEDYVTSVVRQWVTNDLRAGVFSVAVNYWLDLAEVDGQVHAGLEVCPSNMRRTLGPWLAVDRDIPGIVHQLTLAQSATFVNADGVTVRVTADPREHSFRFEEVEDDEPLD
jgi:hypothetical protein